MSAPLKTNRSSSKMNLPKGAQDFTEGEKTTVRTRRKSDCSSYAGGLSILEQKTQNLVVEIVRIRDKQSELTFSRHTSYQKELIDSTHLAPSIPKRGTILLMRGASFSVKTKSNEFQPSMLALQRTASKGKLNPKPSNFTQNNPLLSPNLPNNQLVSSVNELVDNLPSLGKPIT